MAVRDGKTLSGCIDPIGYRSIGEFIASARQCSASHITSSKRPASLSRSFTKNHAMRPQWLPFRRLYIGSTPSHHFFSSQTLSHRRLRIAQFYLSNERKERQVARVGARVQYQQVGNLEMWYGICQLIFAGNMCQYKELVFEACGHTYETKERIDCTPRLEEGLYICSTEGTVPWNISGRCHNCAAKAKAEAK